jgi:hypothetical protein
VGIEESKTFFGEPIQTGRVYFGLIVVASKIAVSEIIGEDQDDVRMPFALRGGLGDYKQERGDQQQRA